MPEIETLSEFSATMDDGARVTWSNTRMTCTCVTARRCPNVNQQMCSHIAHCMRSKVDFTFAAPVPEVLNLCVALPANRDESPLFIQVAVHPEDRDHLRAVKTDIAADSDVLFYLSGKVARLDIREMVWPFLVELSTTTQCRTCGTPPAILKLLCGDTTPTNLIECVRIMHACNSTQYCPAHDISDLIPDLDSGKSSRLPF